MKLSINGNSAEVPDTVRTVEELLGHLGLQDKMLIVELDGHILQKNDHAYAALYGGNQLEIVHFVGGG